MNLLCKVFGHAAPEQGWWGDALYEKPEWGYTDGTGRRHWTLSFDCPRCGKRYLRARFHTNESGTVYPALKAATDAR